MFHGVLTLVGRSLRQDARSWQPHLARLGLMGAIYAVLCISMWNAVFFGAPGLRFFYGIAFLNLTFLSLLGIGFFSTPISEEKEEDTLGLMLMAGISPLGILIGKSGGRLIQAALLVAVQYPFTLLAITMGGVTAPQISAAYAGLLSYMVLLAGFGLLCSTIGSNNRSSSTLMIIGLAAYLIVPMSAAHWLSEIASWRLSQSQPAPTFITTSLDLISRFSVFQQMGTILTSGYADTRLSWQVVSNAVTGVVCFGLSWVLFGVFSLRPATEVATRGLLTRSHTSRSRGIRRWGAPGRAWSNPFLWKDFYFVSGGLQMIPIRLLFCGVLFVLSTMSARHFDVTTFQLFLSLAVVIDAGRVMARSLHDEVRGQTLASLMMLPGSTASMVYFKLGGALMGWLPGLLIDAFVTFTTDEGFRNFSMMLRDPAGIHVIACFVLIPNVALLLALYMRWGAVPLSVAIAFGALLLPLMLFRSRGPQDPVFYLTGMIEFGASIGCHLLMMQRVRQLAAES